MARPTKNGLDYFPFDVDFFYDEKIEAISGEFGTKGEIVAIKLLCAVYRNGYFIEWSEMLQMKLLKQLPGISSQLLEQIVSRLAKWNFFDENLFSSEKIITSVGIQKRYDEAVKRRKYTENRDYWLLDVVNVNNNSVSADINVTLTTQSKVKESKLKEKEKKESSVDSKSTLPPPIDFKKLISYFNQNRGALPEVKVLSETRRKAVRSIIKQHSKEDLIKVIEKVKGSAFLQGDNDRQWLADFDWITKPKNFVKILEGNYDNKKTENVTTRRDYAN